MVELSHTRAAAVQAIGLFESMRGMLEQAPETGAGQLAPASEHRGCAPTMRAEIAELVLRDLETIAVNPTARATALVYLDVHIAQLRASFGIGQEEG